MVREELLNHLEIRKEQISIGMDDEVQKNTGDDVPACLGEQIKGVVPQVGIKMSKAEKKKLKRAQRKEYEKEKKFRDKRERSERIIDHAGAQGYDSTSYIFENGLRKVKPYFHTYQTYARGRWIGRNILEVVKTEFRYDVEDNYSTRLNQGLITVNGARVDESYVLKNHDSMSSCVHRHEVPVAATPITIVHEDEDFLVVNKPSSIPVHPCGRFRFNALTMILTKEMGYRNVRMIHRLDRATSGVLIMVKNFAKTQEMAMRVKNHDLRKEYVCRVLGEFPLRAADVAKTADVDASAISDVVDAENSTPSILVDAPLFCVSQKIGLNRIDSRGKEAQTTFHRLSYNGVSSVVKCIPKTGRTHQIRVHLQYLGFPIMNDRFYNCPALWGSTNGAGGHYDGKSDEKLIEASERIHVIDNYLEANVYSELVRKHSVGKVEEEENNDAEDNSDDTRDSKRAKLQDDGKAVQSNGALNGDHTNSSKCTDGDDHLHDEKYESDDKGDEIAPSTVPLSCKAPSPAGVSSSAAAVDFDPTCKDCVQPTRDPNPKELVMFLHALRYSGPDFDFATALPEWALESWNEEEEWKLY